MRKIKLDFTNCKYIGEIHQILKNEFFFPDYYGENWDALWDCLEYYSAEDIEVTVKGLSSLPKEFDEEMDIMRNIFHDIHKETPNIVFYYVS